jgi:histone acetyltransferase (RNA polymerase elongator complex component)
MKPVLIEIVTRVLTHFDHCAHCEVLFGQAGLDKKFHQKEMEEYPADLKEEHLRLSNWIRELTHLYKHRVIIKLIDVQSLMGIYKSFRHRIRTYPTFIVEGKETYAGWDKNRLESLLDKYIKAMNQSKQQSLRPALP